eukprot:gene4123-13652_t
MQTLGNTSAIKQCCRYIDEDLNRCFTPDILRNAKPPSAAVASASTPAGGDGDAGPAGVLEASVEKKRAHAMAGAFNEQSIDLCIDFHNTNSASCCLIVSRWSDVFALQCASHMVAEAKKAFPSRKVSIWAPAPCPSPTPGTTPGVPWPTSSSKKSPFANVGQSTKSDIGIEIGPQHHGTLEAWTVELGEVLVKAALDFTERFQSGVELSSSGLPLTAAIHQDLLGADFQKLNIGDPTFTMLDGSGKVLTWDGERECYPAFVNEQAYYTKGTAFYACNRHVLDLPPIKRKTEGCVECPP